MILRCIRKFGNFEPGDSVEAPDGAVFDGFYFEQAEAPKVKEEDKADGN